MFNVSNYLEKFKKFGLAEVIAKEVVVESIKEILGITIDKKKIKIQNRIAYIQASPIIKNQIVIKKTTLIETILKRTTKVGDIK
jgi:hypothetical protein